MDSYRQPNARWTRSGKKHIPASAVVGMPGACLASGIIPSVGRTGSCYDNAAAESWNATFKKELIHLHLWKDAGHVRNGGFEYIEAYYNRTRIQRELGYLSPAEYEDQFDRITLEAA
jgi:transposase InsO family protein